VSGVQFPAGLVLESLRRDHPRKHFRSGQPKVDEWLKTKALQQQSKHLSATKVLVDRAGEIAGYYTLAIGQADFGDLPPEIVKYLPKRLLPVAVLAWLGVSKDYQGQGLGKRLLAQSLWECHQASTTFPFVAVVLDCVDASAKAFFQNFDFAELPGHANRLYLSVSQLNAMLQPPEAGP
jgi:GNAT superfamily N-acetyltransferase